jgi:hypothetical protein
MKANGVSYWISNVVLFCSFLVGVFQLSIVYWVRQSYFTQQYITSLFPSQPDDLVFPYNLQPPVVELAAVAMTGLSVLTIVYLIKYECRLSIAARSKLNYCVSLGFMLLWYWFFRLSSYLLGTSV